MEFEFDKKSILDAITKGIHAIFGDDYNIETGEVKQGMEKPCFLLGCSMVKKSIKGDKDIREI